MEEERTITLDLGSSPDPLIDPVLSPPMMPPSTIKKLTPAAERLITARTAAAATAQSVRTSYNPSSVSRTPLAPTPRRQTFELDVGDEDAPQRLLVTVEAESDPRSAPRSTTRRLFQSPTPKHRRLTPRRTTAVTTTTVPLRGLSDDEDDAASRPLGATPKPKGRPRKSGTPATTRRKRPGTPAKRRTSTANIPSSSPMKDVPESDMGLETTPRPRAQSRTTKRKASSPVKEDVPPSQPRKRGRPRKKTMDQDDAAEQAMKSHTGPGGATEEDDIWLSTIIDQPTPALPSRNQPPAPEAQSSPRRDPEPESYDWPDMGPGGGDDYSDAGDLSSDRAGEGYEDTVMAEEFTMISLGSLPSMQPNSSVMVPAHHEEELGEETSLIINGALESLRRSQNALSEQQHSGTERNDRRVEPERATATSQVSDDSRSKPPRLLPSSPKPARQSPRRSPRKTAPQPLARQLAQKSLQQQQQQKQPQQPNREQEPHPPVQDEQRDASAYEDSFSSIPSSILAAATPHPPRQLSQAQEPESHIQPSIERPSRVNHSNPQPETNRLLTPDETPSPIPSEHDHPEQDHAEQDEVPPEPEFEPQGHTAHETDVQPSSSPLIENQHPIVPDVAKRHIRQNSTETPADQQLSAFPPANARAREPPTATVHLPVPESQPRPSLSPIVRAGRALQLVTSDPPSPPGRESVLGSPFRGSSVPKNSQSPAQLPAVPEHRVNHSPAQSRPNALAQSPSRSWLAPLAQVKDFIVKSAQSLSPGRVSVVSRTEGMDDPFGPDPGEERGEGSARNTLFTGPRRQSWDRRTAGSARGQHQEDAMNWQAESSPPKMAQEFGHEEGQGASHDDQARVDEEEDMWMASGMSPQAARPSDGFAQSESHAQGDMHEEEQQQEEDDDDDLDIWAIEAQRPTPYTSRHAPPTTEPEPAASSARLTKPSPWRRGSRDVASRDGLGEPSSKGHITGQEENRTTAASAIRVRPLRKPLRFNQSHITIEDEEFSLLSQRRDKTSSPAAAKSAAAAAADPAPQSAQKKDLAAFFSSPATLPDLTAPPVPGGAQSRPAPARMTRVQALRPTTTTASTGLFSQYLEERAERQQQQQQQQALPSVPQKRLEIGGRKRSADLFAPIHKDNEQRSPVAEADAESDISRSPSPEVPVLRPAPGNQITAQRSGIITGRASSWESLNQHQQEEEEEHDLTHSPPHIPQKLNFTPRKRTDENTLLQPSPPKASASAATGAASLFGNSQITAFFSKALSLAKQQLPQPPKEVFSPVRRHHRDSSEEREDEYRDDEEEEEEEVEETGMTTPPRRLKPLPDRTASPAKSCLRSPLKPKTPGRVVEFVGSGFSSVERGREAVDAGRERQMSGGDDRDGIRHYQTEEELEEQEEEEERHMSSPIQSPSPSPRLSSPVSPSPSRPRSKSSSTTTSSSFRTASNTTNSSNISSNTSIGTHSHTLPPQQPQPQPQPQPRRLTQPSHASAAVANNTSFSSIMDTSHSSLADTTTSSLFLSRRTAPSHKQKPPKTAHQPLSPHRWTRAHWLRLDELLLARRRGPASFRLELARGPLPPGELYQLSPFRNKQQTRPNGVGREAGLVGKEVVGQGERMVLEGWHVEVIEGFLRELGYYAEIGVDEEGDGDGYEYGEVAWGGREIARRVFALLVGGERRRLGLVPLVRDQGQLP